MFCVLLTAISCFGRKWVNGEILISRLGSNRMGVGMILFFILFYFFRFSGCSELQTGWMSRNSFSFDFSGLIGASAEWVFRKELSLFSLLF
jgi:hypothetical protein